MAVPEFKRFIRPTLEALADGEPRRWQDVEREVCRRLGLTEADCEELLPSGQMSRVTNRVHWALTYLRQAGLVENVGRGINRVTQRGRDYLSRAPVVIGPEALREFPEFVEFEQRERHRKPGGGEEEAPETPEERLDAAYRAYEARLAEELLEAVRRVTPQRFERLIVQLMLAMGYGGTEDAGRALGRTGDEGVDGVIDQDKLGLEKIYLQAKKWSDVPVGRKEVQAFVGALSGQGATKGVFITTSTFTRDAVDYARSNKSFCLSLVDGQELARLMIQHNVGVIPQGTYVLKRIDPDFLAAE